MLMNRFPSTGAALLSLLLASPAQASPAVTLTDANTESNPVTYTAGPYFVRAADTGCDQANFADATARDKYPELSPAATCRDGALNTAPVGSYRPNAFGLFDMIGNVEEWVEDCATDTYDALPADGSPSAASPCAKRLVRGGSWGALPADGRAANRIRYPGSQVDDSIGIRVARTLR